MSTSTSAPTTAPMTTGQASSDTGRANAPAVAIQTPDFAELSAPQLGEAAASLDNLAGLSVTVTAELGRAITTIGELLRLSPGSVVELDRRVFEPVELLAQGVRLARGEVVVVDDHFAIRIKEILDPKKRPS